MSHKAASVNKKEPFDHSPSSIVVGEQPHAGNSPTSTQPSPACPMTPVAASAKNTLTNLPLKAGKPKPSSPAKQNPSRPSYRSVKISPHPIVHPTTTSNSHGRVLPAPFAVQSVPCKLRVKAPANNVQPRLIDGNGNFHLVEQPQCSAHNNLNKFADLACEVARVQQAAPVVTPCMQQATSEVHHYVQRATPAGPSYVQHVIPSVPSCLRQTTLVAPSYVQDAPSTALPPLLSVRPPQPPLLPAALPPHPVAPTPLPVLGKRPYATVLPNVVPQSNAVHSHQYNDVLQQRAMAQAVAERSLQTIAAAAGCQAARDAATHAVRLRLDAESGPMRTQMEGVLRIAGEDAQLQSGLRSIFGEVELMKERVSRELGSLHYEVGELREGLRGVQERLGERSRGHGEFWKREDVDVGVKGKVERGIPERAELERHGVGSPGGGIGSDVSGGAVAGGVDEAEGGDEEGQAKRRKVRASGAGKRRRDNWTTAENDDFLRLVHENEGMDEMELRRMLARHFAPRRTHEQCANHLRILRAQNKVPPAVGEAVVYPRKGER